MTGRGGRRPGGTGRVTGTPGAGTARVTIPDALREARRRDATMPPPLLLLPLRLEYRVVDTNVPITVVGPVADLFRRERNVLIEDIPGATSPRPGAAAPAARWNLAPARVTFRTTRQLWFRWFPDEDFTLHGIAPEEPDETMALAEFDAAVEGRPWYTLNDPAVASAWQVLARAVAPERALHLIRHRGEPGDPRHLEALGRIALLPEKVALFALDDKGSPTLIAEGRPIDPVLRYSMSNIQAGGWHTDFDAAIDAGMGVRLGQPDVIQRALDAPWIVAVGIAKGDGAAAVTKLVDDALANGGFAFLQQDTPTNNTPDEPTPYQAPSADLLSFLQTAADAERGVLASPLPQSAELLAEALGIDVGSLAKAPHSGDLALEDARAMLRVVGPALIDFAVETTQALQSIDEEEVIEFFAEAIAARGPLPPVRFGKNPYGVLPVVDLAGMSPLSSDSETEKQIETFVRTFARIVVNSTTAAAAQSVPVIEPGDPESAAKLEAILKVNPVSRRLEVSTGASDAQSLGCPYVTSKEHPVEQYLADLARLPIRSLADPTANEATFPLLYRLARLSLDKVTVLKSATKTPGLSGIRVNTRFHLTPEEQRTVDLATANVAARSLRSLVGDRSIGGVHSTVLVTSSRYLAALERLGAIARESRGVEKLEVLLMECVDLFQYRVDAWATGLAYRRLVRRRRAGRNGLVGGYWGLLGKLRPSSVTGGTDGYLQAPSQHQAVTAAILRSAHLRHQDSGAFAIGLGSSRVRRGLKLLETLQAGLSPNEALGYIAERKLHDRKQDVLIFKLRELFPLRDPRDGSALETRLSDGLAFLKAKLAAPLVEPGQLSALRSLQNDLQEDFDVLSDIALAEATHLRTMGQADGANAWLQVLSGETIPGMPTVLRTRRSGHGSTHRVTVLVDTADSRPDATPRAIAEPALAALVASRLNGFSSASVEVTIAGVDGAPGTTRRVRLADLGLAPMDLLVGGESEVVLRAKHHVVSRWIADGSVGTFPDRDLATFINQVRPVTVNLPATTRALIGAAGELRRAIAQGRALEPGDLSAAADPNVPLKEEIERDLLSASAARLATRARMLATRLDAAVAALTSAAGPVVAAARNHQRLVDGHAKPEELALTFTRLAQLRPDLDAALLQVSRFAEPSALRLTTTAALSDAPSGLERWVETLAAKLRAKRGGLTAALSTASSPANAAAARTRRDALVESLRAALDGDALPILQTTGRVPETTPLLQAGASTVEDSLREWSRVRSKVARVVKLFRDSPWQAYLGADAATGADAADADERPDETFAPRAHLFGTFVASGIPFSSSTITGFVADEWAEQRPSRTQQTGLAINYDAPQSEPPHALLLGEPSSHAPWSPEAAAKIVAQTIALMKTRALAAQDHPLPGTLFPHANEVPFKATRLTGSARIPTRPLRFAATGNISRDGVFVVQPGNTNVGVSGSGLSEISGFQKVND